LWARQVPAAVLASALFDHMILGLTRSVDSVAAGVQQNIERLRRMGRAKDIDCRWVAGMHGVRLAQGQRLETPLGELRNVEAPFDRLPVWSDYPATALLAGDIQMRIDVVQPGTQIKETGSLAALERILQKVRLVRLALLIGGGNAQKRLPQMTVLTAGAPHLGWIGNMTESYISASDASSSDALSAADSDEIKRWCDLFARHYNDGISVAVERVLSAATERRRPTDILIDAVTAWENIVGTEAETSFRVTAALACLLESDRARRHGFMRELQATYRVRSKVVHGEAIDWADVSKHGQRALDIAKRTLMVVFTAQPWLLSLRSSAARADAILLGDPRFMSEDLSSG
jgi:hypothetical protein